MLDQFNDIEEYLKKSTVIIKTTNGMYLGTGFFVGESKVLTCAHVINSHKISEIDIEYFGKNYKVKQSKSENKKENFDLVLLEISNKKNFKNEYWIKLSNSAKYNKQTKYYICSSQNPNSQIVPTKKETECNYITSDGGNNRRAKFNCTDVIERGDSGSPILDRKRGEVIGIISYTSDNPKEIFAIPSDIILNNFAEIRQLQNIENIELDEIKRNRKELTLENLDLIDTLDKIKAWEKEYFDTSILEENEIPKGIKKAFLYLEQFKTTNDNSKLEEAYNIFLDIISSCNNSDWILICASQVGIVIYYHFKGLIDEETREAYKCIKNCPRFIGSGVFNPNLFSETENYALLINKTIIELNSYKPTDALNMPKELDWINAIVAVVDAFQAITSTEKIEKLSKKYGKQLKEISDICEQKLLKF